MIDGICLANMSFRRQLSNFLVRILRTNYHFSRTSYQLNLCRFWDQHDKPPLLIYQMGKVGSETVFRSLKAAILNMPVHRVHFLNDADIKEIEKKAKSNFRSMNLDLAQRLWFAQYVRKLITKGFRNGNKWKIITLVREPISRNIAAFFQFFDITQSAGSQSGMYQIKSRHHNFEIKIHLDDPVAINSLAELFFQRVNHTYPLTYFDVELNAVFGIDVFATNFPKTKGYKIYKEAQADVLLIKLEFLERIARDAFREFLSIDDFKLINANVGQKKAYANVYERFKTLAYIPDSYMEKMYDSKYMRHFYTEEETKAFAARWRNR